MPYKCFNSNIFNEWIRIGRLPNKQTPIPCSWCGRCLFKLFKTRLKLILVFINLVTVQLNCVYSSPLSFGGRVINGITMCPDCIMLIRRCLLQLLLLDRNKRLQNDTLFTLIEITTPARNASFLEYFWSFKVRINGRRYSTNLVVCCFLEHFYPFHHFLNIKSGKINASNLGQANVSSQRIRRD